MTPSSFSSVPIIDANDLQGFVPPTVPLSDHPPAYEVSCYSRGLSPALVIEGYRLGAFPWPDQSSLASGLYPWGRLFPCTVLSTEDIHLSHSLKKRIRDALAGHYKNRPLNVFLDDDFDSTIDAIATYHQNAEGTWITEDILDTWKNLHRMGHAHCVSVYVDNELKGGLYFTVVGRMIYGESMFSLDDDLSKIALVCLAAFARLTHHPLIDCQMATEHVARLGAYSFDASSFLNANRILTATDPFQWEQARFLDLLPFLRSAHQNLQPRAPQKPSNTETAPLLRLAAIGNMMLNVAALDTPCNYHKRTSTMEFIPIPPDHPQVQTLYDRLIDAGFRRDSNYLYRLRCHHCRKCIPTRIDTRKFQLTESMRRSLKKNATLVMRELPLGNITDEQYALYKKYQDKRHLDGVMGKMTKDEVNQVLFTTCAQSSILEFRQPECSNTPNQLIMVCIIDKLKDGLSAVYNFFDPDFPKLSLGTFGIVSEIEFAKRLGLRYVYLGYWLPGYPGMDYKTHYQPLEIFWNDAWVPQVSFDESLLEETLS